METSARKATPDTTYDANTRVAYYVRGERADWPCARFVFSADAEAYAKKVSKAAAAGTGEGNDAPGYVVGLLDSFTNAPLMLALFRNGKEVK